MRIKSILAAAVTAALFAVPASALVVHSDSGVMTKTGQKFRFKMADLGPSDGTGGMLVISSGAATTGKARDAGFDIDGKGIGKKKEFFAVKANGMKLGKFSCGGKRGQSIDGYSMNGNADCEFSLGIMLNEEQMAAILADGKLKLKVRFGRGVDHFGDGDQLNVALKYNEFKYDEVVPAPLPAAGLLLLGGLGAMGAVARRRKSRA